MKTKAPIILVTGSQSGVGLAVARTFARSGYDVDITAQDPGSGERFAAEIKKYGRRRMSNVRALTETYYDY